METIDARGLSCPEPVVMMRRALAGRPAECQMVVDAAAARENVTRYARSQGYAIEVSEKDGEWTLVARRG